MRDFPNSYPKPAWLPDWRDEKNYEDHGDDHEAWAWECLRRDPEYQEDYARWAALPDTDKAEDGQTVWSGKTALGIGGFTPMAFCHAEEPALNPEETAGEYEKRTGIWPEALYVHLCRKWGMIDPHDPADSNSPDWDTAGEATREMPPYSIPFIDDLSVISGFKRGYEDRAGRLLYAWWPADFDSYIGPWAFDLRFNIEDQIDLVREILKERQDELKRGDDIFGIDPIEIVSRPSKKGISTIQTDLRILDAKWSGAGDEEIINMLWGSPKKANASDGGQFEAYQCEAFKQRIKDAMRRNARRIIERGWGDLVRWSFLPQSKKNQPRKSEIPE
jgi:hypothetical protein